MSVKIEEGEVPPQMARICECEGSLLVISLVVVVVAEVVVLVVDVIVVEVVVGVVVVANVVLVVVETSDVVMFSFGLVSVNLKPK